LAIFKNFGVGRAKCGLDWNIIAVLNDDEVIQRKNKLLMLLPQWDNSID